MSERVLDSLKQNKNLSASEFMRVWSTYDSEGKGFIEGDKLDSFLEDFVTKNTKTPLSSAQLSQLKSSILKTADENKDGKIDIKEIAQILPLEENFLLLFRFQNPLNSNVEFMNIWKKYDKDGSGALDKKELKSFLKDFHKKAKREDLSEENANEYATAILQLFDSNKDGMLQINEMAKLLPVECNFLSNVKLDTTQSIKRKDIEKVFDLYDKNKSGTIEGTELDGFLKDLLEMRKMAYDANELQKLKSIILESVEDNKVTKKDLTIILHAFAASKKEKQTKISFLQRFKQGFVKKR
ncbi:calbindin-32-like protein [Dinothrombium tinctorium]|uniref:Calbindin-32-like protein n=1 Tax=Dinothrombium tinctorium TaxID=1965070 RepID=A0A3S3PQA5_9ACAR|nr:calbindin-32-like protein [Dinothrombium tinctorium]